MARKKKKRVGAVVHGLVTMLAIVILATCVASVTYGFFLRHNRKDSLADKFRIEVLNGAGETGLAKRAARALRKRGVDVFRIGNADVHYEESILIKRSKGADVEFLGKVINCNNVIEQLREDPMVDATLILGKDYGKLRLGLRGY